MNEHDRIMKRVKEIVSGCPGYENDSYRIQQLAIKFRLDHKTASELLKKSKI